MSQPHVAIAILNYNGRKYLETYLPSVMAVTYPERSVWVIDNDSTDDSLQYLKEHHPDIKVVRNSGNLGFASGYNEGLRSIDADIFLLLNSDVEVTPGFIEPVIDLMQRDETIGIAQPKIRWLRQRDHFEYAGAAGGIIDSLGYPFCRGRVLEHLEKDHGQYDDDAPIFWAGGACMFVRADVYREMNGMYDHYYMQNEEIDLCWRARNKGHRIYACGCSTVFHLGGGSLEWNDPRKTFYTFRNNLIMISRNMPVGRLLWLLPLRLALDLMAAFRYLISGQPKIGLAVIKAIGAHWKWLLLPQKDKWADKRGLWQCDGVFKGSIVWNYFIKKRRTYSALFSKGRSSSNESQS